MDGITLDRAAERLARSVTEGELDQTLQEITAAAVSGLPGVDYASVTIRPAEGRLRTVARTDPLLQELEDAQERLREGPTFAAAVGLAGVVSFDLPHDERFPAYAQVARELGIHAQASLPIFDATTAAAVVSLYSRTPGAFDDLDESGAIFATRSARALERAQELAGLADAVTEHRLMGRAIGIAMERYALTEPRAFAFLVRLSKHHDVELARVADAVVRASGDRAD